ncbi:MAG: TetR/AcrR family transcriptional regulator [Anaerolineae bacterium]|nr:TetR/AcrR family transcriptional regulator [Anaerolineae bacterium]
MPPTKEERRQQILEAAFLAFSENGYTKTTMDDIVRRSGLSKGTLYWYFKNKEELFVATLVTAFQEFDTMLDVMVVQDTPASERLRTLFTGVGLFIDQNRHIIGLLIDGFFQSYQTEPAQQAMRVFYEKYTGAVETIIRQGIEHGEFREDIDPRMTAISLMAGGDGIALYLMLDPAWDVQTAFSTFGGLILRGMQRE